MIDFNRLVTKLLTEQQGPSTFEDVYKNVIQTDLQLLIARSFSGYATPSNFQEFCSKLHECLLRMTSGVSFFKDLIQSYPNLAFIDFFAFLAQEIQNNASSDSRLSNNPVLQKKSIGMLIPANLPGYKLNEDFVKDVFKKFSQNFSKRVSGDNEFFDYMPINPTILSLKSKLASGSYESVIGKLALSSYKDSSIKQTIYGLLEARKEARQSVIPNNTPTAIDFIDQVLLTPEKFAGAKNVVPAKFKKTYNDTSVEKLILIADKAKKLFIAEATEVANDNNITNLFPNNIKTTLNNFISNDQVKPDKATQKNFFMFLVTDPKGQDQQIYNKQDDVVGGYTIDSISTKLKSEESKELIKELSQFANYIRYQEPANVLGVLKGVSGVTGALAKLGGPEMKM